jgi:hypothetical protein
MFGYLKKLFGFDKETMKEAGVQIEQAPYKVETPPAQVESQITDSVTTKPKPKKRYYNRKPKADQPKAQETQAVKKPAEAGQKRRGRKPKAQP